MTEPSRHETADMPAPNALATLRASLVEAAAASGFTGGVYMHLGHGLRGAADTYVGLGPRRLVATPGFNEPQYLKRNYLAFDPLARRAVASFAPFTWSLTDLDQSAPGCRRVCEAMAIWGMRSGVLAPVQDYALGPALLNLHSSDVSRNIGRVDFGQLMLTAVRIHATAVALTGAAAMSEAGLNPREMDVLRQAAIGRTESETAMSLGLSRRGVQFHLARAVEKLGAPNKTSAVARAVSSGLIRL